LSSDKLALLNPELNRRNVMSGVAVAKFITCTCENIVLGNGLDVGILPRGSDEECLLCLYGSEPGLKVELIGGTLFVSGNTNRPVGVYLYVPNRMGSIQITGGYVEVKDVIANSWSVNAGAGTLVKMKRVEGKSVEVNLCNGAVVRLREASFTESLNVKVVGPNTMLELIKLNKFPSKINLTARNRGVIWVDGIIPPQATITQEEGGVVSDLTEIW
jgi:hypothetical protein